MAKAIHDERCGPASIHRTPKHYEQCIGYFTDHAALALEALLDEPLLLVKLVDGTL